MRKKAPARKIAAELERRPSTVNREIRHNRNAANGQYRPHAAQTRADSRRPRPKPRKTALHPDLRDFVLDDLNRRWNPEQICQALRTRSPDRPELHVVHETTYQTRGELCRELARALHSGYSRRKPGPRPSSVSPATATSW